MPYIRKLPSGKWQATVRGPDGRRHTAASPLKGTVRAWATATEARFKEGDVRDPRAGRITVGAWQQRHAAAAGLGQATADKNASLWAVHCAPKWAAWPMASVTRMEAQSWRRGCRRRVTRRCRPRRSPR